MSSIRGQIIADVDSRDEDNGGGNNDTAAAHVWLRTLLSPFHASFHFILVITNLRRKIL